MPEEPTTDTGDVMGRSFLDPGQAVHDYEITEVAPRTWFLQPSWVNVALFETDADRHTINRDFGRAIESLIDAKNAYDSVDSEFSRERIDARTGLNRVATRLDELRNELIANAGALSGSGATSDAPALAGLTADRLGRESLKAILEEQYQDDIRRLRQHESRINLTAP